LISAIKLGAVKEEWVEHARKIALREVARESKQVKEDRMANILLANHWMDGDIRPLVRIGTVLEKRGHAVTIFSHYGDETMVRERQIAFVAWDYPDPYCQMQPQMPRLMESSAHHLQDWTEFYQKHYGTAQCLTEYEKLRQHCKPGETVVLTRHDVAFAPILAGEKLQVPVAPLYLTPHDLERLKLWDELFGFQLTAELNQVRRQLHLPAVRGWMDWLQSLPRAVGTWTPWYALPDADWPIEVQTAGFIFDEGLDETPIPADVQALLERKDSPVLVCGDSGPMAFPEFYATAIKLCESEAVPTIVVGENRDMLPRNLPEQIHWVPRLPLAEVMPLMKLVIHPGGLETSIRALQAGIPQMILPHSDDGPDNAFRLMELGVAESFPPLLWKMHLLRESLTQLRSKSMRRRCEEIAQLLRNVDSCLEICRIIEGMVGNSDYIMPRTGHKHGFAIYRTSGTSPQTGARLSS
jgi:rhamnosyltransferase subunit B